MLDLKILIAAIGLVMVIEGFPYFLNPKSMKKMLLMIQGMEEKHLRIMGFIVICLGILVIYLAKNM